jgi:hypothetical protein
VNQVARHVLDNTHEPERLMNQYVKHWCHELNASELSQFSRETGEVFHLVEQRIKLEEKHLFPVI